MSHAIDITVCSNSSRVVIQATLNDTLGTLRTKVRQSPLRISDHEFRLFHCGKELWGDHLTLLDLEFGKHGNTITLMVHKDVPSVQAEAPTAIAEAVVLNPELIESSSDFLQNMSDENNNEDELSQTICGNASQTLTDDQSQVQEPIFDHSVKNTTGTRETFVENPRTKNASRARATRGQIDVATSIARPRERPAFNRSLQENQRVKRPASRVQASLHHPNLRDASITENRLHEVTIPRGTGLANTSKSDNTIPRRRTSNGSSSSLSFTDRRIMMETRKKCKCSDEMLKIIFALFIMSALLAVGFVSGSMLFKGKEKEQAPVNISSTSNASTLAPFSQVYRGTEISTMNQQQIQKYEATMANNILVCKKTDDESKQTDMNCRVSFQELTDSKVRQKDTIKNNTLEDKTKVRRLFRKQTNLEVHFSLFSSTTNMTDGNTVSQLLECVNSEEAKSLTMSGLNKIGVKVETVFPMHLYQKRVPEAILLTPTNYPSVLPSVTPTAQPSSSPSMSPSQQPSITPSILSTTKLSYWWGETIVVNFYSHLSQPYDKVAIYPKGADPKTGPSAWLYTCNSQDCDTGPPSGTLQFYLRTLGDFTAYLHPGGKLSWTAKTDFSIVNWGGIEQEGNFEVALASPEDVWVSGFPNEKKYLLEPESEYYIPNSNPNVNINYDLNTNHIIESVKFQTWYVTVIPEARACLHADDGEGQSTESQINLPDGGSSGWHCEEYDAVRSCCNEERYAYFANVTARYVQIRLRGSSSDWGSNWGLRQALIRGRKS